MFHGDNMTVQHFARIEQDEGRNKKEPEWHRQGLRIGWVAAVHRLTGIAWIDGIAVNLAFPHLLRRAAPAIGYM